ncbi:neutral/alkaline ceramidase [Williamsia maris]|uniref:Neutral ceramidase n=1 Tax=Williamsia maris TaxID=72806 RepID=A0ABT1HDC3_9NOCA|nr:neutral/alkaline ceramidase [Williamsia maris]MCP2175668.1 neutral ceramidase [Williamsia maris]
MGTGEAIDRRTVLGALAVGAGGVALGGAFATDRAGAAHAAPSGSGGYLVGCGRADMTGAVAGQGMMGYSEPDQVSAGLLSRCWARAYVIADQVGGGRVVFVNADVACLFQSVHLGVIARLRRRFGDLYTERNVNLNATHNHNSCGGTAWDYAYTLAALGFKKKSYEAEVNGIVNAIVAAHNDLAPGTIAMGRGELHDASANRSRTAFDRNPASEKAVFPDAIDPAVTVLRLRKNGAATDAGQITWFSTHGTSLTDRNVLISGDNKGYASYLAESATDGVVASFPQTNAGDMTPNLWLRKLHPSGPTADNRTNCLIIGRRQHDAGRAALATATSMARNGIESVVHYVDFSRVSIAARFTPEGRPARTGPACMGAAAIGTSTEDNYNRPVPLFDEGQKIDVPDWVRAVQAPKLVVVPLGLLPPSGWIPSILPIQIMRIGSLILAAAPAEFTIVAGLRVRRVVAAALGVDADDVLLQGYANGYSQYVTTEQEYDAQQYEGGETQFGRWTLSAYLQEFDRLARSMVSGRGLGRGPAPVDKSSPQPDLLPAVPPDAPMRGHRFGDVLTEPSTWYAPRATVSVDFVGAHPTNDFHTGGTYFAVERQDGPRWVLVFDDNDWCTELHWKRPRGSQNTSLVTVRWTIPADTRGRFRIRYFGDSRSATGTVRPFTGTSGAFTVT